MFERYTEGARRALFFARYESSRLGATSIGTEHLLLGLMHEPRAVPGRILASLPLEKIRSEIEAQSTFREKIPTSVEVPFTPDCKRVLNFAAEEADRLHHHYIGLEHLLLALMREEKSVAGAVLAKHGLRLEDARRQTVEVVADTAGASAPNRLQLSEHIDRIKDLVQQLGRMPPNGSEARELVQRITDALDALKDRVDPE